MQKVLLNHLLVEKSALIDLENREKHKSNLSASIKPSKTCNFEIDYSDKDKERIPKVIPRAICPEGKCSRLCKEVSTKLAVLQKKCDSDIGPTYYLHFTDVAIGFIRQPKRI